VGIRETWNSLEAVLAKHGFPLGDADEVQQGRKALIRIAEIPGDQQLRGTIGSGRVRLVYGIEIVLTYAIGTDKRVERKVAEDAEDVISAIYLDVNLTNHHFIGAGVTRRDGMVTNVLRFDFQGQT
jgi:hypothetical protein